MQASRLFQAPVQERSQQPTLPGSIRAMKREGEGGREKGGRGRSERPGWWWCGKQERLRDHTEMTKHGA